MRPIGPKTRVWQPGLGRPSPGAAVTTPSCHPAATLSPREAPMLSFETRPAIPLDRAAAIARVRWSWPALIAGVALVLDALWSLLPRAGALGLSWLDLAAIACLGWALLGSGRARRSEWATPMDSRIASGLVLAMLHVVRLGGAPESVLWLRQLAAAGVCYYALAVQLKREPRAPDAVWPVFAVVLLALSVYALGYATQGVAALQRACRDVDLHWSSQYGLGKSLLLLTLLCAGRASEPDARALWRVTSLIGAGASALCVTAYGAGLGVASLASLDEPFYFATSIVAFMLLASLSRMAWRVARERAEEAGRWRAAMLMFLLIAGLLLFGGTSGGEGVLAIAAIAGAVVIAASVATRPASRRLGPPRVAEAPVKRAA